MTYEFEYLMHLFSCGSRGTTPQPPRQPVDFDRLMQLAQEHSVLPLVGISLSRVQDTGFPSEKVKALIKNTRNMALANYAKRRQILRLLQDFETADIQAVLLKGYVVADLYAEPDCRISTDTDIYISTKDEKRAYKLLRDHGCQVKRRSPISHHAACEHPQMGHIELHVILYDEIVEDIWFGMKNDHPFITEKYEKVQTDEGSFFALSKTDNLIFLALHMIKHFIFSGASLRQMMDIALYVKAYKSQIDIKKFWNALELLKYRTLMNTALGILDLYCGFSLEDFAGYEKANDSTVCALLEDLETGGWLGYNEREERKVAWYKYNHEKFVENRLSSSYLYYMLKRSAISYIPEIFPPMFILKRKFSYARKSVWFIPVAWIHHLLSGLLKLLCGKLNIGITVRKKQMPANNKDRVHLFRLMKMI